MQITGIYIISQIITIIYYGFLSSSYLLKDRKKILFNNVVAHIGQVIAMALLNGYTGAAMAFVMFIRDITFLFLEKNDKLKDNKKLDTIVFVSTIVLIIVLTIIAYNGPLSLLSAVATLILTYAVWQKNTKVYKILGLFGAIVWLLYNIFIMSIMGIILQSILTLFTIVGLIRERKN